MQPLKSIKVRASTLNRQRELEIMKDGLREAGEEMPGAGSSKDTVMQGLYARSQTEVYQPEPVVDVGRQRSMTNSLTCYRAKFPRTILAI